MTGLDVLRQYQALSTDEKKKFLEALIETKDAAVMEYKFFQLGNLSTSRTCSKCGASI